WSTCWRSTSPCASGGRSSQERSSEKGDPGNRTPGGGAGRQPVPSAFFFPSGLAVLLLGLDFGDLESDLEAEILLDGPVERLPVADPQRIERRVGGEFGRGRLARQQCLGVSRRHLERLVQHVRAGDDGRAARPLAVV